MRAARRDAVLEANRREQRAFAACSAGPPSRAPWPSSPPRHRPPDRAARHHRRPDRPRRRAGRAGRRRRGARLRLALAARAHPPPAARGHAARTGRGRAARRLQALPRPARRAGHRGRGDRRASGSVPASCWRPSTTRSCWPSRWPRSTTSRAGGSRSASGYGWNRAEAEDHGVDFGRRRAVVREHLAADGGHLVERAGRVPRRVRRLRPDLVVAQAGPAAAGAHADRRGRHRRRLRRRRRAAPTAGSPSAAAAWPRPCPACARWPSEAGRDPARARPSSPSAPSPTRASSSTTPGSASTEVVLRIRAGSVPEVRAQLEALAPLRPVRGHTGATMTDLIDDTAPAARQHHAAPEDHQRRRPRRRSRPTCGTTWLPAKFRDRGPKRSAAASARWSTSAAAPTARPSTPTGPRPTAGSTRTSSTSTSATSPPSASTATT